MRAHPFPIAMASLIATVCFGARAQGSVRAAEDGDGSASARESHESASANRTARALIDASGKVSVIENKVRPMRASFDRTISGGCVSESSAPAGHGPDKAAIAPGFSLELTATSFSRSPIDCAKASSPSSSLDSIFDTLAWARGSKHPYVSKITLASVSQDKAPLTMAVAEAFSKMPHRIYAESIGGGRIVMGTASEAAAARYLAERIPSPAPEMADAGFVLETKGRTLRQGSKEFERWMGQHTPAGARGAGMALAGGGQETTVDVEVGSAFEGVELRRLSQGACELKTSSIEGWGAFPVDSPLLPGALIRAPRTLARSVPVSCAPQSAGAPCQNSGLDAWDGAGSVLNCGGSSVWIKASD